MLAGYGPAWRTALSLPSPVTPLLIREGMKRFLDWRLFHDPRNLQADIAHLVTMHSSPKDFDRLLDVLIPYNQAWAKNASVLMFVISDRFRRAEGREPAPVRSHSFDAGAAWGYLALQASRSGWAAHGMAGFDVPRSYDVLVGRGARHRPHLRPGPWPSRCRLGQR